MNENRSFKLFTIPNLLSIFRILLIYPIAVFVWHNKLSIVSLLVLLAIASDFFDGIIARRFNQISEMGKILDPLADKLAIGTLLIILYLKHQVPLWLLIIVLGRDIAILLVGLVFAKKYKFVTPSNLTGKITAGILAIMVIVYIFNINLLEKIFTPLAIIFIFLSSSSYVKRFFELQKSS